MARDQFMLGNHESIEEHMAVREIPQEHLPIFKEGISYAFGIFEHLASQGSGVVYASDTDTTGYTTLQADATIPGPYRTDLTVVTSTLLSDEHTSYTSAVVLTEAIRLYWNKLILDLVNGHVLRNPGPPTIDGIRKAIRSQIPSKDSSNTRQGLSPAHCSLPAGSIVIFDNTVKICTVVNCYKAVRVPINLEITF